MVKALYSAVSGLNTHMNEMDVIGNNISNVNTTAYKSQQLSFNDLLYQTTRSASAPTATKGGVSAKQIGLGSKTGSIATNISTQGSAQTTDEPFDMMISGNSFFVVNNGAGNLYTRDGTFQVDEAGNLVTRSNGYYVQGWTSGDGATVSTTGAVGKLALLTDANKKSAAVATTAATISGNIDAKDTSLSDSAGKAVTLGIYGADGKQYTLKFKLTDAGDSDATTYNLSLDGITDADGKAVTTTATDSYALKYNASTGKFASVNGDTAGTSVALALPAAIGGMTLDLSATTNYASTTAGNSTISAARGTSDGKTGKGRPAGAMNGVTVSKNGMINATYTNGDTRLLGQVAVAEFANASGLEKAGNNLYSASANSGAAQMMDVTADGGSITTGVLEASNVDLADEFTRMITAQRGFQANSRVITTTDTMLSELRQLKQ
ncbi:MAG: flagellar hook-basal body complex protein [Butyrivibrio sp.]|jgi:flagellar hook protein FlgE|nr:flagellar hook-basal body complex protein [Butyrivibrio sp.]